MKEVVINNDRGKLLKQKIFTFVLIAVVLFIFISSLVRTTKQLKDDYYEDFTGVIETITIPEDDTTNVEITLEGVSEIFYAQTSDIIREKNADGSLVIGSSISGKRTTATDNNKNTCYAIYKFNCGEEELYDLIPQQIKSAKSTIVFSIVLIAVVVGFLAFTIIKIFKTPKEEHYEYVEYMLTKGSILSANMMDKNSKTRKMMNLYSKLSNVGILFIGACLIIVLLVSKRISAEILTILIISLAIVAVAAFVLLAVFKPRFASKHADVYATDYKGYLDNGSSEPYVTNNCHFLKAGLKIEQKDGKEPLYFNYHELNLYTTVLYGKGLAVANIFICSDFPEEEHYKEVNDFVIQLTHEAYLEIIENNVPIKGLEFILTHLDTEIQTNCAPIKKMYKTVIKKYLDEPDYYDLSIYDKLAEEELATDESLKHANEEAEDVEDDDDDKPAMIG